MLHTDHNSVDDGHNEAFVCGIPRKLVQACVVGWVRASCSSDERCVRGQGKRTFLFASLSNSGLFGYFQDSPLY